MLEVSEIAGMVEEQADRDCILIFGATRKTKDGKMRSPSRSSLPDSEKASKKKRTSSRLLQRGLSQENLQKKEPKTVEEDVVFGQVEDSTEQEKGRYKDILRR